MSSDLFIEKPDRDVATNVATQIRLLVAQGEASLTVSEYVKLVHGEIDKKTKQRHEGKFNRLIEDELIRLLNLGIETPEVGYFSQLPFGSWFLKFTFILAKPWISRDDDPFYVTESVNPVRKDKVFKVPFMSAAAWKGLLRWMAMHKRLELKKNELSEEEFAMERFRQSMLFGDEKGEEPGGSAKEFAGFLDRLKPGANGKYRCMIKEYFGSELDKHEIPRHSGRLTFFPSFFNKIDLEVINPHSRKTKAGTHPIYLESVPAGAKGTFSLIYVPFDLIGRKNEDEIRAESKKDLALVAEAISVMMLTHGFSAKRTSGYGAAQYEIDGFVRTRSDEKKLSSLKLLDEEVHNVGF